MKAHSATGWAAILVITGLAAVAAPQALAGQRVDEQRPANSDARIRISNVSGSIAVTGWDREEVAIRGILGDDVEKLDITGDSKHLTVEVILPKGSHDETDADLEIQVPNGAEVDVSTVSADISVERFPGSLRAESVSGDVTVAGRMKAIELTSVSGEIDLAGDAPAISIQAISGDVLLHAVDASLKAELSVETVSGDVILTDAVPATCEFESVSGDLAYGGAFLREGVYDFSSHSGDIDLHLANDVGARFEVSTLSGDIHNDFEAQDARSSRRGRHFLPGADLDFTLGDGAARVRIETFSGDVTIRPR